MSSLVLELGYNQILSVDTAVSLRNYIASRNPSLSVFRRAEIFADAVNRIVDLRIPRFSQGLAKRLKETLFRDIAQKPQFSIDCADVFKAAVKLKTLGYEFFRELSDWLSGLLKKSIIRESLFDYVIQAHRLMDSKPDQDVETILESVEKSIGGLKYTVPAVETAAIDFVSGMSEKASDDLYDYGESIMEYIRPGTGAAGNDRDETVLKKAGLLDIVKKALQSVEPRRVAATSALAAAALAFVLFAGYKINAASDISKTYVPEPVLAAAYSIPAVPSRNLSLPELKTLRMRATAYDLSVESCGKTPDHPLYGITSSGTKAKVGRTVAVDPEVIPLGSRVYISFPAEYKELDGVYTAEDTGRLIKGDSIDIFFGEDKEGSRKVYESAMKFGVRYVDVDVLD